MAHSNDSELDDPQFLLTAAAEIYEMRRARDHALPSGLASEPAWDILLALYIEQKGKITVGSACRGSGVPKSTALRWVSVLEAQGLVHCEATTSSSVSLVWLTKQGRIMMERCLKAMLRVTRD